MTNPTKYLGDLVTSTLNVKNSGSGTCSKLWFGLSYKDPTNYVYDMDLQTDTVAVGSSVTKTWTGHITSDMKTGQWLVRMSVWNAQPPNVTEANRLADTNWVNAFVVSTSALCTASITSYSVI